MRLYDILTESERSGLDDCEIGVITDDTRKVGKGDIFVAITGRNFDGHAACADMLAKGAAAVVIDHDLGLPQQILCENTRIMYSVLSSRYFGEPTKRLKLIAATGTNGKTTTVNIIKHILNESGHKCGCIGTAGYDVCGRVYEAHLTTPYQFDLYGYFREMADNGAEYCVMEASSQALSQHRFTGERFVCGIFTNLTQDHLDWHGTMENYYLAKKSLFRYCDSAVINTDDPWGKRLYGELQQEGGIHLVALSEEHMTDVSACSIRPRSGGVSYVLTDKASAQAFNISIPMPGTFNVMNSMGAAAACVQSGLDVREAAAALNTVKGVCGRAEVLYDRDYTVICDYAHTEDGLEKTLSAIKPFVKGRLIVVFGAAGERDAGKRPAMGRCVAKFADIAVITSDNPRFEDPGSIIDQVKTGFDGSRCETHCFIDRLEAIKFAVSQARADDVIALCGKGHEEYQVIGDDYMHFSEHEIIAELCV
ncbi:MAG: UDP-N-acetylmuramoyl-L-alanyl-D-glutamate--2,6-diaminopimelate ligase [Ruminiclostridium sp.]|nr:UDP-N-acetylmuramoyl-L-alanyl-D-glutamate--2,6-diaminopimelate ligase [Ruminiclostridium sp.]